MVRIRLGLFLCGLLGLVVAAQAGAGGPATDSPGATQTESKAAPSQEILRLFDYDASQPPDVSEVDTWTDSGAQVADISYRSASGGRVPAYLVVPPGEGPFAGIVYQHWGDGDRASFLGEAIQMAGSGAVSVLVEASFARPQPWRRGYDFTDPGHDRDLYAQGVIDLRRAVDLLVARPDVNADWIGFVGHSFGAHMGAILSACEPRIRVFALMGGPVSLTELLRTGLDPSIVALREALPKEQFENYLAGMAPLDAIHFITVPGTAPILFQFAWQDRSVTPGSGAQFFEAAREPKELKWYSGGHELNDPRAFVDRVEWMRTHLGLGSETPTH